MDKSFLINPLAVIFHDELDARNGYETIACNWNNETYIKINPPGYKILRLIDEQPGLSLVQIAFNVNQRQAAVEKFLEKMVQEKIVFAK